MRGQKYVQKMGVVTVYSKTKVKKRKEKKKENLVEIVDNFLETHAYEDRVVQCF